MAIVDLGNFCMMTAFGNLKLEAFRMESSPPPVELSHVRMSRDGQSSVKTYKCLVPAATTADDWDMGRFETLCQ